MQPTGEDQPGRGYTTGQSVALLVPLVLLLPYSVYFAVGPRGAVGALLELLFGAAGVGALLLAGMTRHECYLRVAPLSRPGAGVLLALGVLLVPVLVTGAWEGWTWSGVLFFAPVSGVAQELYFRSSLLPSLVRIFDRPTSGLLLQALLFALWHVGMLVQMSLGLAAVSALVLFLAGLGWGWQTLRDRTAVWAMAEHTVFLVLMSLFGLTWG